MTAMTATSLEFDIAALAGEERMRALAKNTDWSGLWFDLVEKQSGEFVGMRTAHVPPPGKAATWHFLTHRARDGIGALVELMRRRHPGADIAMPRRKGTRTISRLARVAALLRLMTVRARCARWTTYDRDWAPPAAPLAPSVAVAARALDVEQTRNLQRKARARGICLNSLLLAALSRAAQSELGDGPAYWMMPVNMRGLVAKADESANHTAYLRVNVERDATGADVHETVRRCFANNEHWGSWLFLHIGRVVGYAGMKLIYRMELARWNGCLWVGAFANLGVWKNCGDWLVCPPVAKSCPLGAGAIVCNGKLGLTIDAHASIAKDALWTHALMDRWIAELDRLPSECERAARLYKKGRPRHHEAPS